MWLTYRSNNVILLDILFLLGYVHDILNIRCYKLFLELFALRYLIYILTV